LEQAALAAHRSGQRWADFWPTVAFDVRRAEPINVQRYHRLVRRLLALVTAGDVDGLTAIGDAEPTPWEVDDAEPADSRYRKWGQEDNYLNLVKPHRFRSKGAGDATEFRFNVALWRCLDEKAQRGTADSFHSNG